jgi:hypothetical protein
MHLAHLGRKQYKVSSLCRLIARTADNGKPQQTEFFSNELDSATKAATHEQPNTGLAMHAHPTQQLVNPRSAIPNVACIALI